MAKKIMFNDKYSLTQAVLDGRKTMTRRIIKCPRTFKGEWVAGFNIHRRHSDKKIVGWPCMYDADEREFDMSEIFSKYKVGEVVAIAQSYLDLSLAEVSQWKSNGNKTTINSLAGWTNKLFVKAELMPHHISITNIKIEKLQGISDEDCLKEGIVQKFDADGTPRYRVPCEKHTWAYATDSARDAYHFLIDKVSGKGTWESNPYVFVYEFELID